MNNTLSNIIREGQEKTLQQMELLEKQMNGTITPEETQRLVMLNGNLLALARQAQAQGFGTQVGLNLPDEEAYEEAYEEDYEEDYGEEDEDWY